METTPTVKNSTSDSLPDTSVAGRNGSDRTMAKAFGGKHAETGGNAGHRGGIRGEPFDAFAGRGDLVKGRRVDGDLGSVAGYGHDVLDGQGPNSN